MKINAIRCRKCGDTIYSRARHDFRWCSCKSVAIDGGFDYCKMSGEAADIESVEVEVEATKKQLYDDYNSTRDKYGLLKAGKGCQRNRACVKQPGDAPPDSGELCMGCDAGLKDAVPKKPEQEFFPGRCVSCGHAVPSERRTRIVVRCLYRKAWQRGLPSRGGGGKNYEEVHKLFGCVYHTPMAEPK